MTLTHILVEAMDDVGAAREASAADGLRWYTTAPMVAESLAAAGDNVHWVDAMLPKRLPDAIGHACFAAARALQPSIEPVAAHLDFPQLVPIVGLDIFQSVAKLTYKSAVLENWIARTRGRHIVVGETAIAQAQFGRIDTGLYDTLYAALADRGDKRVVEVLARPARDLRELYREVDQGVLADRLLSFCNLSPAQLSYRLLRFLFRGRPVRLPFGRQGPDVVLVRENEMIREMLPALLAAGARVGWAPAVPPVSPGEPVEGLPDAEAIGAALADALKGTGARADVALVGRLVAARLAEASRWWQPTRAAADRIADDIFSHDRPTVLVSNTIGGVPRTALAAAATRRGVPLVLIEHGISAGTTKYHKVLGPYLEPALGNGYLVCSERAAAFFRSQPALDAVEVRAIGLPAQTRRVPLRRTQRWIARRRIGARCGQRVVLYVARSVQNNLRRLPYLPDDHAVHTLQRTMADTVMPQVRGLPAIKLYSTRRYRDPDPLVGTFAAPPPVATLKPGDFRFLRAAADVIVMESPLSTLGWALGAGKPLFFLVQPTLPLLPEARAALETGVFVHDIEQADWPQRLVDALNRPDDEILQRWQDKAVARERFLEEWVFGPEESGKLGAAAVIEAARAGTRLTLAPRFEPSRSN